MKRIVPLFCAIGISVASFAQFPSLFIATDKTTSLIFPFPIAHVDRGTGNVLVQQVKEAHNILLVKAASVNFPETNLSVVTGDGSVYSFVVKYDGKPSSWVYELPSQTSSTVASYARSILNNPQTMHGIRDARWDMLVKVAGIFIKDKVMYYQLLLNNQSAIDYDIDFLRFYIRDKRKSKRTAVQENEMIPVCIAGNIRTIKANSVSAVVVALEKFTVPDAKFLAIEVNEKNGGRHLLLKVNNRKIIRARLLQAGN